MFDPLTAATLSLEQIVELCDELIAAHGFEKDGGFLPNLDAKATRVAGSGKAFGKVNPKDLRASWDNAQKQGEEDFIRNWQVIGPFKCGRPENTSLEFKTPLDDDFVRRGDGSVDLKSSYRTGDDQTLRWQPAQAGKRGQVKLDTVLGRHEHAIAYAYVEIESIHPREVTLGIGSDDGVRVWVNGKAVHTKETQRGYQPNEDEATVHLKAGTNRILLKIDNYAGGWGFGLSVPKANF